MAMVTFSPIPVPAPQDPKSGKCTLSDKVRQDGTKVVSCEHVCLLLDVRFVSYEWMERWTGEQKGRILDRQTGKQTDRQTEKHTDIQADKEPDRQRNRHTDKETDR